MVPGSKYAPMDPRSPGGSCCINNPFIKSVLYYTIQIIKHKFLSLQLYTGYTATLSHRTLYHIVVVNSVGDYDRGHMH